MPRRTAAALLSVLLLAGSAAAAVPVDDFIAAALQRARAVARPALVIFVRGAGMTDRVARLERDPGVRGVLSSRFADASVRVDIALRSDLADRYRITSTPTFLVLQGDGKEIGRLEGEAEADGLEAFLSDPGKRSAAEGDDAGGDAPAFPVAAYRREPSAGATESPRPSGAAHPAGAADPGGLLSLRRPGDRVEATGSIDERRREVLFRVRPEADALLSLRLVGGAPAEDLDLAVFRGSYREGDSPAAVSNRGGSALEEATTAVGAGREATVRVYGYNDEAAGPFTLEAELREAGEGWRPVPTDVVDLPFGREVLHEVTARAPERWFRVYVSATEPLVVTVDSERDEQDVDLEVYTADGRLVAVSDGEGGDEEAVIDASREYWFFLRVFGFEGGAESPFRIRTACDAGRTPPRPIPDRIEEIRLDEEVRGEITAEVREAWYRVYVEETGTLVAELDGDDSDADLDLEVFTDRGEPLGRADAVGPVERLEAGADAEYWFVLRVYGFDSGDSGRFRLRTSRREGRPAAAGSAAAGGDLDGGPLMEISREMPLGETVAGRLEADAAEAWHRVYVEGTGTLRFVLDGADDAADLDLEIYDKDRNLLGSSDGEASAETVRGIDASREYHFFARVFPYVPGTVVDYAIRADLEAGAAGADGADEAPPADAESLGPDAEVRGVLEGGDAEGGAAVWRRILPSADGSIGVFVRGEGGDLDLMAVRADGTQIGRSASTEPNEALLVPARAGEPFFIKVYGYRIEGRAPFVLWWTFLGNRAP